LLAIVIPYYRLAFFEATLESLANQTDKRFKVYIGDDASPDDPSALLGNYKNRVNFDYFRFDENLGARSLTQQWERCLEKVTEDWVLILGDDDVLGTNCVARFNASVADSFQPNVIRFATAIIDEKGLQTSEVFTHPTLEKSTDFLIRKFKGKTRSSLGEYVFRKSSLLPKGFRDYPLAWHSDEMAVLECSNFGEVFTINEAVVFIRESDLSISGKSDNMALKQQATWLFCSELVDKQSDAFTAAQIKILLQRLEKMHYRDRRKGSFITISCWYLSKTGLINLVKFVRRYLLSFHSAKPA